jgi:hypothetical protein
MSKLFLSVFIFVFTSCINRNSETSKAEVQDEQDDVALNAFPDGTYDATVYYTNSETDYSATYTLEVEVEDNQVTVIHFPNGGHLDADHITPGELDEDGQVTIEGEDGKTYEVDIDK